MLAQNNLSQLAAIEAYAYNHTKAEPKLLQNLVQETELTMPEVNMLTGRIEGRFLKLLLNISGSKNVLEIGTFTGYSALCMAEALPNHGKLLTCELSTRSTSIAQKYFARSPHGHKINLALGPALDTINSIRTTDSNFVPWDFVFIDADKLNYLNYYQAVLPKVKLGGLIVIDNALWGGEVTAPQSKNALAIAQLNQTVYNDQRVENVFLNVRDGINIVRKIKDM